MSVYTSLCSRVLFPLHEALKKHDTVARLRVLEKTQWWTSAQLMSLQQQRLQIFMRDIHTHIPYYAKRLAELDIPVSQIQTVSDLQRLPLLDKAAIRAAGEQLKRSGARLQRFNTGGSTGEPLVFFLGHRVSHDVAAKWRATRWWNVDIGDKEVVLWGSPVELSKQDNIKQWRDRLLRSHLLPAFDLSDTGLHRFITEYHRIAPQMLFGYPSALARVAEFATQHGLSLRNADLRVVFVTAERLYPYQRDVIARAFGAPVANGYGARDAGFIAHECPYGNLHICAEDIVLETVDENGKPTLPGVSGELVVTHFATSDFPFVRYRTGDHGVLGQQVCACGRGLPLLADVQGRSTDFVLAQDGTVMHGLAVIYVLRDIEGIASFRLVQHSVDDMEVMLVCSQFDDRMAEKIRHGLRARLGAGVTIRFNLMNEIPRERNGKFRYVISHAVNKVACHDAVAGNNP